MSKKRICDVSGKPVGSWRHTRMRSIFDCLGISRKSIDDVCHDCWERLVKMAEEDS